MKKFNFKAFFVDHGEKLGFGVGLLLVLIVLAGSDWFPYAKDPAEIIVKAEQAKSTIDKNTWPEDVRKGFSIRDYSQSIRDLRGPLATTGYDYSTPLWHPLYRPQQLAKDPEFLAVMDLEAKAGLFVMAVAPKVENKSDSPTDDKPAATVAAADDDEFARAAPSTPNPFAGGPGALGGSSSGGVLNDAAGIMPLGGAGAMPPGGVGRGMDPRGAMMLMGESAVGEFGGASMTPGVTARGERFVSVRGVWPVLQQLQRYRAALNLQSVNDARSLLEITNFILERKTASAGADPWAGEWQTLEITRAKEILSECPDFDIDIFDPRLVDVTITMPLPKRLIGRWGDYATHPQIKNFELKGPELEKELKLQDRLMREYEKLSARLPQKPKARGGFSDTQANIRSMADTMFGSAEGSRAMDRVFTEPDASGASGMGPGMGMGGTGPGGKLTAPDLKARLTAAERLFLFRYFDFDVRPGYAYRYRVKLELRNPNYQRPQDQVIDKSVAEGETRETEWSQDSTVAVVPETTSYFLKNVVRDPVQDAVRSASKALAYLKMYQWDRSVGTMIVDTVQVMSIGQFLGEKRKSWHLDVAKPSFKEEEVTFQTDDLYLDGIGDLRLSLDEHKDLKLPSDRKGMLGLNATAVVMTDVGELKAVVSGTEREKEDVVQNRVDRERAAFESIKGQDAKAANPLDGGGYPGMRTMLEGETPGMFGGGPGAKKGRGGKANPRKLGANNFAGSSGMSGN